MKPLYITTKLADGDGVARALHSKVQVSRTCYYSPAFCKEEVRQACSCSQCSLVTIQEVSDDSWFLSLFLSISNSGPAIRFHLK